MYDYGRKVHLIIMSKKNKSQNFLVQGSILAAASLISRIIGILYRIPLTDVIGDAGMGYYQSAFEIYSILLIISSYSLPLAVSKLVSAKVANGEYKNAQYIFKHALQFAGCIGLFVGIIDLAGADLFVKFSKYSESALAIKTLAPTLLILSLLGVFRGYFQGLGTMLPTATSNIIEQIVNAIVSIVAAWILFKVGLKSGKQLAYGAAGGTIGTGAGALAALIFMLFLYFAYRKIIKKKIKKDKVSDLQPMNNVYKLLIVTILPVIFNTAVYNISGLLDGVIFSNIEFKKGVEEMVYSGMYGIYSSKYRVLMNVPIAIASALATSIIPTLIASKATNDYKSIKRKTEYSIRFSMIIAIPSAVGLAVFAKPIILLLFGSSTTDINVPVKMMWIGAISIVFYSLSTITNAVLQGIDKMKIPVIHAGISVGAHIVLLVVMLLVFNMSINAVVIADAFFALLICILNSVALKKYIRYKQEYIKTFILPGIAAILMGVVSHYTYTGVHKITQSNLIGLGIAIIFAVLIYILLLLALKVVTENELRYMPKGNSIIRILKKFHML